MSKDVDNIIDGHKIHLHPDKVNQWKKEGDCYPIHIEIGVTGRCNHKCIFCALDFVNHKQQDIDKDVMINALKEIGDNGVNSVMFGGEGEPTLHKDIGLFVKKSKEYGIDVAITTNGVLFDKELQQQCLPYLSWIKFSVDAGTPDSYAIAHGINKREFGKLIRNIEESADYKRKNNLLVTIGTQFLMMPQSIDTGEEAVKLLKAAGADYISIKPYSHHPLSNNNLFVDSAKYNELEERVMKFNSDDFKVIFRKATLERINQGHSYQECYGLPFISLIDSKGNILPCNLFYGLDEFTYGNLYKNSFREIWEGDKRKKVVSRLKEKGTKDCRKGCRCDAGNRYLYRLKNPELHDNFT